jgi:hypothetical protein
MTEGSQYSTLSASEEAVWKGHDDILRFLLSKGANLHRGGGLYGTNFTSMQAVTFGSHVSLLNAGWWKGQIHHHDIFHVLNHGLRGSNIL